MKGVARRHERETIVLVEQSHRRHRRLHGNRIGFDEVHLDERQQPVVQLPGARVVAALAQLDDLGHLCWRLVRRHGDDTAATNRHVSDSDWIVATQHNEVIGSRREDFRDLRQITGRLDADNVRNLRQPRRRFHVQIDRGAARNVVQDDRQPSAVGNRLEVLVHPFRRGLVVVRRDGKKPVRAGALNLAREVGAFRQEAVPGVDGAGGGGLGGREDAALVQIRILRS